MKINMKWISVKDKLPNLTEENERCSKIVAVIERNNSIPIIARFEIDEDGSKKWRDLTYNDIFNKDVVTHWIELPISPKT